MNAAEAARTVAPGPDLLSAALAFASRGWPVFPCEPRGKKPLTPRGFQAATTDPATIRAWWERWPAANIGIWTGGPGLLVVDLDRPKPGRPADGVATFAALVKEHGTLPPTPRARTGRGGLHLYFRDPGGIAPRADVLPGVDTRAGRSYVVAPPSVNEDGNPYTWVHDSATAPLADAPDWLVELLRGRSGAERPRRLEPPGVGESIPQGQRNDRLFRLAASLRAKGLSELGIRAALLEENRERCDPPLPENEVERIAGSAGRYPEGGPGRPGESTPTEGSLAEFADSPPIPLEHPEPVRLPRDVLPGWLGDMAGAVADSTETPLELAAMMGLAAVAAAVQKRFTVNPEPGYFEPLNVWTVAALDPGNRKSSVKAAMTRPLTDWERAEAARLAPAIREAASKRETALARVKSLRGKAASAKTAEEARKWESAVVDLEEALPEVPLPPRLWCQDVTPEKLGSLLADHDERLALLSDEGGIFETLGGRYSNGVPNLDLFLQAHSGDPVRVDRGSRPPVVLEHPALTIGLSPQPDVLRGLADKPGFRGRGLLARFLITLPPSPLGQRKLEARPVPDAVAQAYAEGLGALLRVDPGTDEHGRPRPYVLRFAADAYTEWKGFQRATEAELADGGRFEHCRDWGGKLPGAAARLAGILHCVEHPRPWERQIGYETTSRALTLAAALSFHAVAAFELMGADPALDGARRLWRWVSRQRAEVFSARDAFNALKGTFRRMTHFEAAAAVLIERGYVRELAPDPRPGRPSRKYVVHPQLVEGWR